jgi:hypothetical protein
LRRVDNNILNKFEVFLQEKAAQATKQKEEKRKKPKAEE